MRTNCRALPIAAALLIGFIPTAVFAQSDAENRATARALAQQGQEAFDAKDYAKSDEAFRRADALFHAPTLTLGLARAQAAEGKFVESWESYNRIILENVTSTPVFAKALEEAKKEIAAVDGRRSRVTVTVTGPASANVTLDNAPLKPEALGVPLYVNPGAHTVQASADGFNPGTRTFAVTEGNSEAVALALEPGQAAAPPPAPGAAPGAGAPGALGPPPPPSDTGTHGGGSSHVPAIIAFSVGGAGLVIGGITGILALGQHSTLKTDCQPNGCPSTDKSKLDSYHTTGIVSTVGFIVAGVGVAAGITLWVVESKSSSPASASISPYVGLGTIGAVGRF